MDREMAVHTYQIRLIKRMYSESRGWAPMSRTKERIFMGRMTDLGEDWDPFLMLGLEPEKIVNHIARGSQGCVRTTPAEGSQDPFHHRVDDPIDQQAEADVGPVV